MMIESGIKNEKCNLISPAAEEMIIMIVDSG